MRGSAFLWGVWILVGGAGAIPAAGGAGTIGTGLASGHRILRRRREPGRTAGRSGGRLFAVDLQSVREIRPGALAMRFAFGAAISVVAGLVSVVAGQRVGGVMLAAPAVLPATLTIIERQEGRGPAVTEVQGSVPGAVALIGFAVVAATAMTHLPLAGALLAALGTWIIAAIGGYLLQSAALSSWRQDVRDLAVRRRDAARARRAQASPGGGRTSG